LKLRIPVNPVALAVGLGVVVCAVAGVLYIQRGAHTELKGAILKVRTLATDEQNSLAVADFRFVNPSDYPFVVREVNVSFEDKNGKIVEGFTVSESDARRVFEGYPQLGQKFNDSLFIRNKIPARQSWDRMIAATFQVPESELQSRRKLIVRIVDLDGPTSELLEKK
jgi:hypothetical protein